MLVGALNRITDLRSDTDNAQVPEVWDYPTFPPVNIVVSHRPQENLRWSDLETAVSGIIDVMTEPGGIGTVASYIAIGRERGGYLATALISSVPPRREGQGDNFAMGGEASVTNATVGGEETGGVATS